MDPKRPADPQEPATAESPRPAASADEEQGFDARQTLVDGPPKMERAEDPEEKETELWAPAASLFVGPRQQVEPEEADTEFDPGRSGEYRRHSAKEGSKRTQAERSHAAKPPRAVPSDAPQPAAAPQRIVDTDPEILPDTNPLRPAPDTAPELPLPRKASLISGELEIKQLLPSIREPSQPTPADPVRLFDSVEVSGEVGVAARKLAEEERQRGLNDPSLTMVVDAPRDTPRLAYECRICGRKVTTPKPTRLRHSPHGDRGFRCEKCSNVFCGTHVVRVSGLLETLFRRGRFRCVLCMPAALPKASKE